MTQKLALYFLAQGDGATRVLEADQQPEYTSISGEKRRGWTVGRLPTNHISFRRTSGGDVYAATSKQHAVISAKVDKAATLAEGEPMFQWEISDWPSTNGTFLESPGSPPYRLAPGVPYKIVEGAIVQFGCQAARVKFSFDIDDTHGMERDTDPRTGLSGPKKEDKVPHPSTPWFVPAILDPGWLWFTAQPLLLQVLILILVAALAALWIDSN